MDNKELIKALRQMTVETGSLVCLGCGHEHSCGIRGCAVIKAAADALEGRKIRKYCAKCNSKDPREMQSMRVLQYNFCPECGRSLRREA